MRLKSFFVLTVYCFTVCETIHGDNRWEPTGFWKGQLEYRGDELEIGVHIRKGENGFNASLDIPSLVYANQPLDMHFYQDRSVMLDFPFGIGQFNVFATEDKQLAGKRGGFSLNLMRSQAKPAVTREVLFGAGQERLQGRLHLPATDRPVPVVVLIAGSGNVTRESWSYASWVDFYLGQGVGAFIYDRRPELEPLPDGSIAGIEDHAEDVLAAVRQIKLQPGVEPSQIGLAGASRGAWIAMSVARQLPELAFLILSSPAAATPAEQETDSVLTGMRDDGLDNDVLSAARGYLRLYFYVAQTGIGWPLLESAIKSGQGTNWLQYVDQPRVPEDLLWWRNNMNFDAVSHLQGISIPVLALWGGRDFITPWADYRLKLESSLRAADNEDVTTRVYKGADHRLEIGAGENEQGQWHWFGLAPGVLEDIGKFVHRSTQNNDWRDRG